MTELQLKPLLLALSASLLALFLLVIVWPRFFPPHPVPFVEHLLTEVRSQNYGVLYGHLSERWRRQKTVREYVDENLREEELFIKMGGFVESTWVDQERVEVRVAEGEATVPVVYRMKALSATPPRELARRVLLKLVYEHTRWRLDGLKVARD